MMSIKIEKDDVKELTYSGSMLDLLAEVGFAVHLIYNMIARSSPPAAEAFRNHMVRTITNPRSPIWEKSEPNCLSIVQIGEPKEGGTDDK